MSAGWMPDWLPTLGCPSCAAFPLEEDGENLVCPACKTRVPVLNRVARFVPSEEYSGSFGYQWNRFSRTQLDSANGSHRSREAFLEKTGWNLDELAGDVMLDAGCGMGRFTEIAASAGAHVCGVDLSTAVDAAARNLADDPNVRFFQADIMNLPFAPHSFDRIYSIGVLHHTPDTRQAFLRLVELLKPGGQIAIWVYSTRLGLASSELLRRLTPRLPKPTLLRLCRVAVPLGRVHRVPILGHLTYRIVPVSTNADPEWRWLDTFDWYSPRYQWKHDGGEVRRWFEEAGLVDVRALPFPVSFSGAKPA